MQQVQHTKMVSADRGLWLKNILTLSQGWLSTRLRAGSLAKLAGSSRQL